MQSFERIDPKAIDGNFIELIGDRWMLVTAGDEKAFNTMTASWGGVGYLWNKPVAFVFVRPQRYTFEFVEKKEEFTLSFLRKEYKEALMLCGSVSGRTVDKVKEAGLTPRYTALGNVTFEESCLMLECRTLYGQFLQPGAFIEKKITGKIYPEKDFHKVYIAEIINAWRRKEE